MLYIAQKPCSFGGKKFLIGDTIDEKIILPGAIRRLTKAGIIAVAGDVPPVSATLEESVTMVGQVKFETTIHAEEGDLKLEITEEALAIFTEIRQLGTNKTEDKQKISELLQKADSVDALIFIDAMDGRKFVQEEAQKRAQALTAEE